MRIVEWFGGVASCNEYWSKYWGYDDFVILNENNGIVTLALFF